ncbi:MAG: N-acetyltransferase, partial [Pseudomonas sp.]|nr:N-acetyltransferase [Pseudomonas sp.]
MSVQIVDRLSTIAPAQWDALVPTGEPFLRHAFLTSLEDSGSLGPRSGWQAEHAVLYKNEELIAALPAYRKWHSYGEYVFDHAWADACRRAGIAYYPKLLVAVPFSPVSGARILMTTPESAMELLGGLPGYLESQGLSSAHVNFTRELDDAFLENEPGWLQRIGCQFHWHNRGYRDFQDFLDAL